LNHPQKEPGRGNQSPASSHNKKTDSNVVTSVSNGKSLDLTSRSQSMGRDECICRPNKFKDARHTNRPDFHGTIRLSGGPGHYYQVALWQSRNSFNLWFTPWNKTSYSGVEPLSDLTPIRLKLWPNRSGDPPFSGDTRKASVELRPATCNGREVWWLRLVPRGEVAK
jgi:hypothetical protein